MAIKSRETWIESIDRVCQCHADDINGCYTRLADILQPCETLTLQYIEKEMDKVTELVNKLQLEDKHGYFAPGHAHMCEHCTLLFLCPQKDGLSCGRARLTTCSTCQTLKGK